MRHFISIADCTLDELNHTLDVSAQLKKQYKTTRSNDHLLAGKTLAMLFEKPSLRTRVSFDVAMTHLGGRGLLLRDEEVGLGKREPLQDVARVLSGMCDGIMARTFEFEKVVGLAKWATIPVINGLTDFNHPCQAMADFLTIREKLGELNGRTLAYIGDANNMARSLAVACGKFGLRFAIASPAGYAFSPKDVEGIRAAVPQLGLLTTSDPEEAVKGADVIYTDTWVSMGQEAEKAKRVRDFAGFMVDEKLAAQAPKHAIVMHCLPAYRGLEISEGILEGPQSVVFDQAENRLHFQKGLVAVLLGGA
ncbi:MAG: ornithine carbamoyltransferase [Planctomycetota bacterium]|nr:ornithine carbamoyltransferase [Planctomycetota bacterium]